jgi:hypothetical protein
MKEWLKNIQVGDLVMATNRNGHEIVKVQRITKTQIVVTDGRKFNNQNGDLVGGGPWGICSLIESTPEMRQAVYASHKRIRLSKRIKDSVDKLPLDILEQMVGLLPKE